MGMKEVTQKLHLHRKTLSGNEKASLPFQEFHIHLYLLAF